MECCPQCLAYSCGLDTPKNLVLSIIPEQICHKSCTGGICLYGKHSREIESSVSSKMEPKSFWFVEIRLYNAAGIYSAVFVTEKIGICRCFCCNGSTIDLPDETILHIEIQGNILPLSRIKQKQEVSWNRSG